MTARHAETIHRDRQQVVRSAMATSPPPRRPWGRGENARCPQTQNVPMNSATTVHTLHDTPLVNLMHRSNPNPGRTR
jgi:hypothetical protein